MPIARLLLSLAREASREHRRDPRDSSKATVSAALRSNERYHAKGEASQSSSGRLHVGATIETHKPTLPSVVAPAARPWSASISSTHQDLFFHASASFCRSSLACVRSRRSLR